MPMRRALLVLGILGLVAVSGGAYYTLRARDVGPQIVAAPLTRGDIVEAVGATGTLEAVTTVQVGTQVSGTIKELYADFNAIVRKGQVIARLDPSLLETQIDQARANLLRSEAEVERLGVTVEDTRSKLARAGELAARQLISRQELEAAQLAVKTAEAQLRSSDAQVTQARATLNQNAVNLRHTVIESPIDGIVISRNVDVGQTVAASMQAPTLFVLAADLSKMKVNANIDEADVGRIRPGQPVRFRVDAFPSDEFLGTVSQVRLQPVVVQNVVTYATVIDVPNPDLRLKPGMTANVTIEIARRAEALRVPNAALRFRPTPEVFDALGQDTPPELQRGGGRTGTGTGPIGPGPGAPAAPGAPAPPPVPQEPGERAARPEGAAPPTAQTAATPPPGTARPAALRDEQAPHEPGAGARGRGAGSAGGEAGEDADRARRVRERLEPMSPEEREQALARMLERGVEAPRGARRGTDPPAAVPRQPAPAARPAARAARPSAEPRWQQASTIDALFGPLPETRSAGRVWVQREGQLVPIRVVLGVSDGTMTEIVSGDIDESTPVVTAVSLPNQPGATAGRSPLMGPQRGGPPGARNQGGPTRQQR
jgi:HlyD family secretion protein